MLGGPKSHHCLSGPRGQPRSLARCAMEAGGSKPTGILPRPWLPRYSAPSQTIDVTRLAGLGNHPGYSRK